MIYETTYDDGRTVRTESVSIPSLSIGDIVIVPNSSGVRLRLTERKEWDHAPGVVQFVTEHVDGDTDGLGQYGRDMRDGKWRIQGNDLSRINRCL